MRVEQHPCREEVKKKMGKIHTMKGLAREFMSNPKASYFNSLDMLLSRASMCSVSTDELIAHLKEKLPSLGAMQKTPEQVKEQMSRPKSANETK